jgi:protein-S-isoprenylcysteine O-methyltransferase Ste14
MILKNFMIQVGNFFFRWRDTAFTFIFLPAIYLFTQENQSIGGMDVDIIASISSFVILLIGQIIRGVTVGYAYIKRGGLNKTIYAETLVHRGMFAHSRNPLYLGNILIVTGSVLNLNLLWYSLIILPIFYFIYFCITFAEEKFLAEKFKEDYTAYTKNVNRFIPSGLSTWKNSIEGMDFTWKRFLKKEFITTTVIVFSAFFLANALKFHYRYSESLTSNFAIFCWTMMGLFFSGYVIVKILMFFKKLEIEARVES